MYLNNHTQCQLFPPKQVYSSLSTACLARLDLLNESGAGGGAAAGLVGAAAVGTVRECPGAIGDAGDTGGDTA